MRREKTPTARKATGVPSGTFDPRLLHDARATRRYLVVSVILGALTALAVIA
jgi:hypothetical protein